MIIDKSLPLPRRTVLRGAGIALALPFLEAMAPRRAAAQTAKKAKRFLTFWTPNGTVMSNWRPTGGETDFKLGRILAPLEPHRKDLIVLEGVDLMTQSPAPCGHYPAVCAALTGQPTLPGNVFMGQSWPAGISVDQHIANSVGKATKIRSLELSVGVPKFKSGMDTLSYAGPSMPLPIQGNPATVFSRLFGDGAPATPSDPGAAARLSAENKTVLDAVLGQFQSLGARLGTEDRRRLDAHAQQIREIEQRLSTAAPAATGPGCRKPEAPASLDYAANQAMFPTLGKLQMDLAVLAFACDLTRVITLMWANGTSGQRFTWVGVNDAHHGLSHATDGGSLEKLTKINVWYMQQLAYLIERLKVTPDGTGTALDGAIILSNNELTDGAAHSHPDAPLLLAGGAGGYFKMGRYLKYGGRTPHNNLLLSIVNAMGIPDTSFGKKDWCTGALPRLTA